MFYIFDTEEEAVTAERKISENMGYVLPKRHAIPALCTNPANKYYGKWYFAVGNVEKKEDWLKDLKLSNNKKKADNVPWIIKGVNNDNYR
jgi:hypothetical protein